MPLISGLCALSLLLAGCGASIPFISERSAKNAPEESAAAPAEVALPPEAVQQFERAGAQMSAGDLAAAEQGFLALATAYPSYSGPLLNLGILHAKAGKLEAAEKVIRDAIARNGNNAAAYNQLGIVYRKLGRFKEADEAYQRAVQVDPNYALAYLNMGVLCDLYLQEPERALEAYERYLSLASAPDAKVSGWVSELKKRIGSDPRSAKTSE
jgi:tetratricopeptide (TPR) repeat protein